VHFGDLSHTREIGSKSATAQFNGVPVSDICQLDMRGQSVHMRNSVQIFMASFSRQPGHVTSPFTGNSRSTCASRQQMVCLVSSCATLPCRRASSILHRDSTPTRFDRSFKDTAHCVVTLTTNQTDTDRIQTDSQVPVSILHTMRWH